MCLIKKQSHFLEVNFWQEPVALLCFATFLKEETLWNIMQPLGQLPLHSTGNALHWILSEMGFPGLFFLEFWQEAGVELELCKHLNPQQLLERYGVRL